MRRPHADAAFFVGCVPWVLQVCGRQRASAPECYTHVARRDSWRGRRAFWERQIDKTPHRVSDEGFWNLILTMTYSHMGKPHTTIGDASFHY